MFEKHICPICWAFQDPTTGKCLVCGKNYNYIYMPVPLNLAEDNGSLQDYCIPIQCNEKQGYLTFQGRVGLFTLPNSNPRFIIDIDTVFPEQELFTITMPL